VGKEDPGRPGPYRREIAFSTALFWQVAPWKVRNGDHPGLPESEGEGVVMLGQGNDAAVHLAWMRIDAGGGLLPASVRYYTGDPSRPWSAPEGDVRSALGHEGEAARLFVPNPGYTSVSAAWLPGPRRWVVLYSKAAPSPPAGMHSATGAVVARFGASPWSWSDEVEVFCPCREDAYGRFMHWSGLDDLNRRVPPVWDGDDRPGWAYGAFYLERFTSWSAVTRELSLVYLVSTSRPYQVQVMRSRLRFPSS
jgi:hypothetical protein